MMVSGGQNGRVTCCFCGWAKPLGCFLKGDVKVMWDSRLFERFVVAERFVSCSLFLDFFQPKKL